MAQPGPNSGWTGLAHWAEPVLPLLVGCSLEREREEKREKREKGRERRDKKGEEGKEEREERKEKVGCIVPRGCHIKI